MNIANKQTLFKFILERLENGVEKSTTELMEEFIAAEQISNYHKRNVKQQFHRAALNLVEQGLIQAKKYPDIRYLLFSKSMGNSVEPTPKESPIDLTTSHPVQKNVNDIESKLEQLEDEEASLKGREEGLNYLLSLQPESGGTYRDELKQVRHERMRINAFRSVIMNYNL